jgi:hypothetical protein
MKLAPTHQVKQRIVGADLRPPESAASTRKSINSGVKKGGYYSFDVLPFELVDIYVNF